MIKQFLIDYEKDLKKKNKTCNNINILYIIYLFSILGGLIIIISKDFLLFFICLELINFSSIVILLYKENRLSTNITLIYLIINSISSILILLGILYIYIENNIIDILEIENIFNSFI
ncbi:MAG: proton-conducting transporter membrane subunit [Streptosporangiaceae bacterium]